MVPLTRAQVKRLAFGDVITHVQARGLRVDGDADIVRQRLLDSLKKRLSLRAVGF